MEVWPQCETGSVLWTKKKHMTVHRYVHRYVHTHMNIHKSRHTSMHMHTHMHTHMYTHSTEVRGWREDGELGSPSRVTELQSCAHCKKPTWP